MEKLSNAKTKDYSVTIKKKKEKTMAIVLAKLRVKINLIELESGKIEHRAMR